MSKAPESSSPLICQRDLFSIPAEHCWLNSAYMGPMAKPVVQAGEQALAVRAFPLSIKPDDFFAPAERVRAMCAELVNADAEKVALIPTSSYGTAIVANNIKPRPGQNIVVLAEQFPSNVYPWRQLCSEGISIRAVSAPEGMPWSGAGPTRAGAWNQALLQAIDQDTALVAIEQAHWTDGTLFDLVAIGERCRQVGAVYLIDATQTVGAMPLDVRQVRPDALVVHSYKAMLSNYGLGFVVLGDRFAAGEPIEQNWLMRAGSEDFSNLLDYQDDYSPGMRRYDSSLRANPSLIMMLEASCQLLLLWQPERIREYLLGIERDFVTRVRELGFSVADEAQRAANIFGIGLPAGLDARQVAQTLAGRNIHVSVRGSAVRVAPHVYNDKSDLATLADVLNELVQA